MGKNPFAGKSCKQVVSAVIAENAPAGTRLAAFRRCEEQVAKPDLAFSRKKNWASALDAIRDGDLLWMSWFTCDDEKRKAKLKEALDARGADVSAYAEDEKKFFKAQVSEENVMVTQSLPEANVAPAVSEDALVAAVKKALGQ